MSMQSADQLRSEVRRALAPDLAVTLRAPEARDEAALRHAQEVFSVEGFDFALATALQEPGGSFRDALVEYGTQARGTELPPGQVRADFLLAESGGQLVGRTSIRYELTDSLRRMGGHVGYAVLPEHRRHGYATAILRASLERLAKNGTDSALVTCSPDNAGSVGAILACGGVLENELEGKQRYWIALDGPVLRPLTDADQRVVWRALAAAMAWREGAVASEEELLSPEISHYARDIGREGDAGVVCFDRGWPVGAAWFRLLPPEDPGYGFVAPGVPELTMAVLSSRRGTGLGRLLLTGAMDAAREAGYERVSLSVEDGNHAARSLYEEAGFERVGRVGGSDTLAFTLS